MWQGEFGMRIDVNEEIKNLTKQQSSRNVAAASEVLNLKNDVSAAVFENGVSNGFFENENIGKKDNFDEKDGFDAKQMTKNMQAVANSMNEQFLAELQKEMDSLEEEDVEAIVTVQEKIRMKLEAFCENFDSGMVEEFSAEQLASIGQMEGNSVLWANKLKENNLPVTDFNIRNIQAAFAMMSQITQINDGAKIYFVQNPDKAITIESLYISNYSANKGVMHNQSGNYYSTQAGGYVTQNSVGDEFEEVSNQIKNLLQQAGIEITDKVMQNAKWLYDRQLPVNEESLNRLETLQQIELPFDEEKVFDKVSDAMKGGHLPIEAELTGNSIDEIIKQSFEIFDAIQNISDEQLRTAIANVREDVTVSDLLAAYNGEIMEVSTDVISDTDLKYISAKRQLEEIRLQMTVESVALMQKNGISVNTSGLSELIDNLKIIENNLNARLLEANKTEVTAENIELFSKVNKAVESISVSHAKVIGIAAFSEERMVLSELEQEGRRCTKDFKSINDAYEAVMTKPRADMGDSIKSAFRNVDDILDEMNIEKNMYNKRAVRILGYNNIPITDENINRVKEADISLNQMLSNMKPSSVVKMIRDNFNPLNATVSELNDKLNQYYNDDKLTEEKYSEFLWKMEHNNEITENEKESYIGIYRLVNQIKKSDGALVGALVLQGAEVTMGNLLMASRTRKHSSMDYKVDDNFNGVESGLRNSISNQIEKGFNNYEKSYYSELASQIADNISLSGLNNADANNQMLQMTLEDFAEVMHNTSNDEESDNQYMRQQLDNIRNIASMADERIINVLSQHDITASYANIEAVSDMMKQRGGWFKKILKDNENLLNDSHKLLENMGETEEFNKEYNDFAKDVLETARENVLNESSYVDIRAMKLISSQISISVSMSDEEMYQIPVEIGGELTSINLKFRHNSNESQKVTVSMYTEKTGNVEGDFSISAGKVKGIIVCDNTESLSLLEDGNSMFEDELQSKMGLLVDNIVYVHNKNADSNNIFYENLSADNSPATSKQLYQFAKIFIQAIRGSF